ncbi:MAG: hypothetical protein ACHQET_11560 [Chitinophagales bacterium]
MELIIKDGMLIKDFQKSFNDLYPLLKIEFFRNKHAMNRLSPMPDKLPVRSAISLVHSDGNIANIDVSENVTVGALEQELWNKTGLSAQVFRKSRNLWIETSLTDKWTLEKQSKTAEQFVMPEEKSRRQQIDDQKYDME